MLGGGAMMPCKRKHNIDVCGIDRDIKTHAMLQTQTDEAS